MAPTASVASICGICPTPSNRCKATRPCARSACRQGMIASLSDFIDAGKIKFYSVNSINGLSFYNKGAHPFHRSYVQKVFDSYLREEVVPFIRGNCQSDGISISTMGASFGAYHAANSLFKHPDVIKRCGPTVALMDFPCSDWEKSQFIRFNALPPDGYPVAEAEHPDQRFKTVAKGLRAIVAELRTNSEEINYIEKITLPGSTG